MRVLKEGNVAMKQFADAAQDRADIAFFNTPELCNTPEAAVFRPFQAKRVQQRLELSLHGVAPSTGADTGAGPSTPSDGAPRSPSPPSSPPAPSPPYVFVPVPPPLVNRGQAAQQTKQQRTLPAADLELGTTLPLGPAAPAQDTPLPVAHTQRSQQESTTVHIVEPPIPRPVLHVPA